MRTRIKEVQTSADWDEVYRFRYLIYVEEMDRLQEYADHNQKLIQEPLDRSGHVLAAYADDGHIVGTVRFNVGVDEHFGLYVDLYHLKEFGQFFPSCISITTKLMIAAECRKGRLAMNLALECYDRGLNLGTCFDCIDCNEPLVGFFMKLGYRQIYPSVRHPEYGEVTPLVLVMHDTEYLKSIRSPLAKLSARFKDTLNSVAWFKEAFGSKDEPSALFLSRQDYESRVD